MSSAPQWEPVDSDTADLLSLVADEGHPSVDHEWERWQDAIREVAYAYGVVDQNRVRPLIRGWVAPKRIGAFYRRACAEGWLRADGYSISDDVKGRNSGRPMRVYRLVT